MEAPILNCFCSAESTRLGGFFVCRKQNQCEFKVPIAQMTAHMRSNSVCEVGTPVTTVPERNRVAMAIQPVQKAQAGQHVQRNAFQPVTVTLDDDDEDDMPPPNCQCLPAKLAFRKTAQTPKNKGRVYWTCPEPFQSDKKCRFFAWEDELKSGMEKMKSGQTSRSPVMGGQLTARSSNNVIYMELLTINSLATSLHQTSFKPSVLAAIRELPGARVLKTAELDCERVELPLAQLDAIRIIATQNGARFVFDLPPDVIEKLRNYHRKELTRRAAGNAVRHELADVLPPSMVDKLMDYQIAGIHFALDRGGRCLIGDDMGLGKTLRTSMIFSLSH
jgi:GRF zinc finger